MTPISLATELERALGRLRLIPSGCEILDGSERIIVEPRVMQVLVALAQAEGAVVSRQTLIITCWDGRAVSEDAINRALSRIRQLAQTTGAFNLRTVRKVGYRLDVATRSEALPDISVSKLIQDKAPDQKGRRRPIGLWVGIGLIIVFSIMIWWMTGGFPRESHIVRINVSDITVAGEQSAAQAADLRARLEDTLSRIRDVRLIEGPHSGADAEYQLTGALSGPAVSPEITLRLSRLKDHNRVWTSHFIERPGMPLTSSQQAVAAAAQYVTLILKTDPGTSASASSAAPPEIAGKVTAARQTLAQAHDARSHRDWDRFKALMYDVDRRADDVLAQAPRNAGALMLKYQLLALPRYPRTGEDQVRFAKRLSQAEAYLAQAVEAAPDDPEVLSAAAQAAVVRQDWAASDRFFTRALAIDPNAPDANLWYGYYLGLMNRCSEGLDYARKAAALVPNDAWRQLAVPRLLLCDGKTKAAGELYAAALKREPGNVFILREVYMMRLAQRDAKALLALNDYMHGLWQGRPPQPVASLMARIAAGAEMLNGKPAAYDQLLQADLKALDQPINETAGFGPTVGDSLFRLGLEYAEAGNGEAATGCFMRAVNEGALPLPWALPYGAIPIPSLTTQRADYKALWKSTPQLNELTRQRKANRSLLRVVGFGANSGA
ncbi:winged helix-turn-helix domain-containing protein [Asticcacaulis sp. YBE204]|uniref:winged helix-turn-helix domain-containing protein n=1 Tax=Asticcacaulis sp. YBE204 TaxID=1282363 RepID=UPI0003C3C2FA|nr:winged helix-turn-helix domain-containing protein [Asticcacaulis sp. YBE204]ESQ79363.1 hypothetical protein AEYBE204_10160 [Asticcacaulis sp. YBE204]